jgi:hypothetical protein
LFQVVYTEDALREWFSEALGKTCSALSKYPPTNKNVKLALASLRGLAAFASLTTKTPEWSSEQEVRHVTMDRLEPGVRPNVRVSADDKEIRYLPVSLRTEGKLIALDDAVGKYVIRVWRPDPQSAGMVKSNVVGVTITASE